MNELLCCPFCGGNAELKTYRDNLRGDTFAAMCQKTDCPGRTYRKRATLKAAIEAWNRRAEPENRVLTLEELEAHCKGGAYAAPLWVEFSCLPSASHWMAARMPDIVRGESIKKYLNVFEYNALFRCWLRKPTEEETAGTPWEGENGR